MSADRATVPLVTGSAGPTENPVDRLRRAVSLHSPQLGVPPLSIKRLLRKVSGTLRAAPLARNFPPRSLDPEPPAVRSGAHCGGGEPRHPPRRRTQRTKVKTSTEGNDDEQRDDLDHHRQPRGRPGAPVHPGRAAGGAVPIASRRGTRTGQSGEWKDGDSLFLTCAYGARPPRTPPSHDPGHPGDRHRAAPPALLRDQGRRQAHRLRTRGGRGGRRSATPRRRSPRSPAPAGERPRLPAGVTGEDADPWASEAPGRVQRRTAVLSLRRSSARSGQVSRGGRF